MGFFLLNMYTVYVLYSEKYEKNYVGYTSNIEQRLLSHNELDFKSSWIFNFMGRLFSSENNEFLVQ